MRQSSHHPSALLLLTTAVLIVLPGCVRKAEKPDDVPAPPASRSAPPLTIFLAAGLHQVFDELARETERDNPGLTVQLEASGSLEAARKLTDYHRMADLVVLADERLMNAMLIPEHASWSLSFCADQLVLAYSENSRYAAEVDEENWAEILLREDVRICRGNENLAPIGYRTLMAWQLADILYAGKLGGRSLYSALSARVGPDLIRPDVEEIIPLIGTDADYAIIYRSTAHDHNLQFVRLPPEVNLANPKLASFYSKAKVAVKGKAGETKELTGSPIVFALTIPSAAENEQGAIAFVERLLGDDGTALLTDHGFTPIRPAVCEQKDALPPALARFTTEGGK